MGTFTLMNKNNAVLDFEYDNEQHLVVDFNLIYKNNEKYSPFRIDKKW